VTVAGQHTGLTDLPVTVRGDIRAKRPDWELFRDGCSEGESPAQVASRAERVITRIRALGENGLMCSSGHFIRVRSALDWT
jgi:probable phosphoglycerate mutase